uniref:Reverse transcriptase domain-containing protein n=1 Tax=Tanacetum cinerariifolium TaxID=118510 RepID=A0A699JER4_TANCI|nr:reverse transcriptase domain-containing protein [Tanacetum cinerariifolium]
MERPFAKDDESYNTDERDETINKETQVLLENEQLGSFLVNNVEKTITQMDQENFNYVIEGFVDVTEAKQPIHHIDVINTGYSVGQKVKDRKNMSNEHLYSASANEIDLKRPELKDLPSHLEYAFLHNDKIFPIIISSKLSEKEKRLLLQVLEKRKGATALKMSDIKGIGHHSAHIKS